MGGAWIGKAYVGLCMCIGGGVEFVCCGSVYGVECGGIGSKGEPLS